MKRDMILKLAASTMVISTTLTGCGPFGGGSVASVSSKPATAKDGPKYAKKAEKALAKGQIEKAIVYAERSVAGVGNNSDTRALLGQVYLSAGRFSSAERSFHDAMDLGKNDARTVLSLGLAQLAQGKANKAKQLIDKHRSIIPTADYGLALALSGEAKQAVDVLEQAIRDEDVNGRTRQNLGLAYAMDGRWREAKLMAMQDITPTAVDQRIMQWAQMARPGAYEVRVASLLNVTPVSNDPGQPARLALNAAPLPTPAQDYSTEVASFDREAALPAIGPAPVADKEIEFMAKESNVKVEKVAVPASKPAELIKAPAQPVRVAPEKTFVVEKAVESAPAAKPAPIKTAAVQAISAVKPVMQKIAFTPKTYAPSTGKHLVQLGVFSTPENVKKAWKIMSSKNKDLASFSYASSTVNVKGRTLYRLAAMGFGNETAAKDMCAGIKAKGDNCIVRYVKGVNPRQMASASRKLASR